MAKQQYVIGNWKMYKTAREATDYIEDLIPGVEGCLAQVYLAVPFTSIAAASRFAKKTNIIIGAQNMNDAREGAFTGEIAGLMLKEAGADFVLLGHSERRHVFHESDDLIHKKVLRALQDDIQPVLCIGETLEHHGKGQTQEVLQRQIEIALEKVPAQDAGKLILAYEPVWAIGSGKTPTPKQIQKVHAFCKRCLEELFGKKTGSKIPVLYGGSVKPDNVAEIALEKDIDGVLVGGASLDPKTFAKIVQNIGKSSMSKKRKIPSKKRS